MSDEKLPESLAERVQWVIAAPNQEELRRRYDLWASQYDSDVSSVEDYLAPMATAEVAKTFLLEEDRILDAGAGTGLSGSALKDAGFPNLVAVDFSAGMLAIAEMKGVYKGTVQADLGQRTPFDDNAFDAAISVGTTSQMPAESLREMTRVVRPGGHILFTVWVQAYNEKGYAEIERELTEAGRLSIIQKGEAFQALPTSEPDLVYEVWVFKVLA